MFEEADPVAGGFVSLEAQNPSTFVDQRMQQRLQLQ